VIGVVVVAAVALLCVAAVTVYAVKAVQHAERQHARERQLLVNQVCALAGRPWLTPPADEPAELFEPPSPWDGLTASPDQWPGEPGDEP